MLYLLLWGPSPSKVIFSGLFGTVGLFGGWVGGGGGGGVGWGGGGRWDQQLRHIVRVWQDNFVRQAFKFNCPGSQSKFNLI